MLDNTDLKQQVNNVIKILEVSLLESEEVEAKRKALEKSQLVNTDREMRISARELEMSKKQTDIASQVKYIEEQSKNTALALNKIAKEKQDLRDVLEKKSVFDQERIQFEEEKKIFDALKKEKEAFFLEKQKFEEEKKLFSKEKLALIEAQHLLSSRESNMRAKEEKLDKIDRMTQV